MYQQTPCNFMIKRSKPVTSGDYLLCSKQDSTSWNVMDVMWLVILQANQSWREARRGMGDATPSRNHWHNELITLYRRFDASSSFEINHKVRESSSEESWITSLTSIPWGAYSYGLVLRASLKVMPTLSSLLGFIRISWSRVGDIPLGLWYPCDNPSVDPSPLNHKIIY